MILSRVLPAVAAVLCLIQPLSAGEPRGLEPFSFLIGVWRSSGSGTPGGASGSAEFSRVLMDRVIVRSSIAEYPPAAGNAAYRHEDLMVVYVDTDSTIKADYFDNEGHVIRYSVQSPAQGEAVFLSLSSHAAPRYRLTYSLTSSGTLDGKFEIAPPGGAENFATYLTWSSKATDHRSTPDN